MAIRFLSVLHGFVIQLDGAFRAFFREFSEFFAAKGTAACAVPFTFYSPDNAAESSCSAAERFVCSSIVLMPVMSWLE